MEMLYIEPSTVELTEVREFESYDEVKKKHAIERRRASFSFLKWVDLLISDGFSLWLLLKHQKYHLLIHHLILK